MGKKFYNISNPYRDIKTLSKEELAEFLLSLFQTLIGT